MLIGSGGSCLSTFHYGSIKISVLLNPMLTIPTSTFHYGSIKILYDATYRVKQLQSTFHYGSIKIYDR